MFMWWKYQSILKRHSWNLHIYSVQSQLRFHKFFSEKLTICF
jgi:hypothetical protein